MFVEVYMRPSVMYSDLNDIALHIELALLVFLI